MQNVCLQTCKKKSTLKSSLLFIKYANFRILRVTNADFFRVSFIFILFCFTLFYLFFFFDYEYAGDFQTWISVPLIDFINSYPFSIFFSIVFVNIYLSSTFFSIVFSNIYLCSIFFARWKGVRLPTLLIS